MFEEWGRASGFCDDRGAPDGRTAILVIDGLRLFATFGGESLTREGKQRQTGMLRIGPHCGRTKNKGPVAHHDQPLACNLPISTEVDKSYYQ